MDELLSKICAQHEIEKLEKFERGETQANYKIQNSIGAVSVLRVFKSLEQAEREIAILEKCRGHLVVPQILFKELGDNPYIITSYLTGDHLSDLLKKADQDEMDDIARSLAKSLAQIHSISWENYDYDAIDYFNHIHQCLFEKNAEAIIGPEKVQLIWQKISDNKKSLSEYVYQTQLVHCDFKGSNILMTKIGGNWQVSGVLDWEFGRSASPLYDISNFCKYIRKSIPDSSESFLKTFIETYSRSNETLLSKDWEETCMYLDLIMHCDALVNAEPESRRHKIGKEHIDEFLATVL